MPASTLLLFFIGLFLVSAQPVSASYLYLSPQSKSVEEGQTFSVEVKLNTQNEVINGVSAYLAFPKDRLDAVSVEPNKQLLPIEAENSIDGNVVKVSRANFSSVNGDVLIATIKFNAKKEGQALVEFIPGSGVPRTLDSSDSLKLDLSRGGQFQVTGEKKSREDHDKPTPKPNDRKIARCQEKEAGNKSRASQVTNFFLDRLARIDTIFVLVDGYYQGQNLNIAGYPTQKQAVEDKRTQARERLERLKSEAEKFSCNIPDPRNKLVQIKSDAQNTQKAFREYKDSVKTLIKVVGTGR